MHQAAGFLQRELFMIYLSRQQYIDRWKSQYDGRQTIMIYKIRHII
jgi:hypothetical protein